LVSSFFCIPDQSLRLLGDFSSPGANVEIELDLVSTSQPLLGRGMDKCH
jgi:hypothetical protein